MLGRSLAVAAVERLLLLLPEHGQGGEGELVVHLFAPVPAFVVRTSRVSTVDSTSLTEKRRVIDKDENREKDKDKEKVQVWITT